MRVVTYTPYCLYLIKDYRVEFSDYFCFGVFLLIPLIFLGWWIRMRLGLDKRWFVMPAAPLISRNFYFFLPAFSVGFTIFLLGSLPIALDPNADYTLMLIGLGVTAIGFVFAYLEPDWLSPAWYRWLKRKHGDILPDLAAEAHRLGRAAWLSRVQTQADLEQWVAEVRRKHGLHR